MLRTLTDRCEQLDGGDGGIRTLDRALQPYNGLANRRLQPLGHISGKADMPDTGVTRKRADFGSASSRRFNDSGLNDSGRGRLTNPGS